MKYNRVYLASASPRRQQLLEQVDIAFTVIKPEIDESQLGEDDPKTLTQRLAYWKALDARNRVLPNEPDDIPIVAADTAVAISNQILGKPDNGDHAREMLTLLSNRTHEVYSSICVMHADFTESVTQVSSVTFRKLSEAEITSYWRSGEPRDKAGAYAIQGRAARFISHLSGSYSGVMGLPLYELMGIMDKISSATPS